MIKIYKYLFINEVPLERFYTKDKDLIIEMDDINEKRRKLVFKNYQAIKILFTDYYDVDYYFCDEALDQKGVYQRHVLEKVESEWIEEIKRGFNLNHHGEFDEKNIMHHYILDLGDFLYEIISCECMEA